MRGLAVATLTLLGLAGCGAAEREHPRSGSRGEDGRSLARDGITLDVPAGWDASISHGALRAANFRLSELRPGESLARTEVLVLLFETDFAHDSPPLDTRMYRRVDAVPTIDAGDFTRVDATPGTTVAREHFQLSGRPFDLFVEAGDDADSPASVAAVNALLGSIDVRPGDFYPGTVEPPRFAERSGWNVGSSGPRPVLADGNFLTAWAATVGYRDPWNGLPPSETLEALPDDGIVIWVGLNSTNRFAVRFPAIELPLRLADFERRVGWEGQVGDLPEYVLWGKRDSEYEVEARVYFGRPQPTPAMEAEADAMLAQLQLPRWAAAGD